MPASVCWLQAWTGGHSNRPSGRRRPQENCFTLNTVDEVRANVETALNGREYPADDPGLTTCPRHRLPAHGSGRVFRWRWSPQVRTVAGMRGKRGQAAAERKVPGTILREIMKVTPPPELIEALAQPHRARAAFWRLLELGPAVSGLVRAGLRHPHPGVRAHCCQYFDHFLTPEAYPDLVVCLDDPDPDVRRQARHALECDRCKAGDWPPPADALAGARTAEGR